MSTHQVVRHSLVAAIAVSVLFAASMLSFSGVGVPEDPVPVETPDLPYSTGSRTIDGESGPASEALRSNTLGTVGGNLPVPLPEELPPRVRGFIDPGSEGVAPPLPPNPVVALSNVVVAFSSALGIPVDPSGAPLSGSLSDEWAGRLALVLEAQLACHGASSRGALLASVLAVPGLEGSPDPVRVGELQECSSRLYRAAVDLERAVLTTSAAESSSNGLDLWPVVRLATGTVNEVYVHDYALTVDLAGDDLYANNAGGNLLDVQRGPPDSPALIKAPARGCQQLADILKAPPECVVSASVVIDLAGNDTYGKFEAPDSDSLCTRDLLVRRFATQGAGLAGVGILLESQGNDAYTAKTLSQGSGHVGGVGVLRDSGGNDKYLAIRTSQGFALVGGLGVLVDDGGDDSFDSYMPGPRPGHKKEFGDGSGGPGSGGVIDDVGLCDSLPRQLQGSGFLGGVGALVNRSGNDTYLAAPPKDQKFTPEITFSHGSQGFGGCGSIGVLFDQFGKDTYAGVSTNRVDGAQLPTIDTRCVGTPVPGLGVFADINN